MPPVRLILRGFRIMQTVSLPSRIQNGILLFLLFVCPVVSSTDLHELSQHRAWKALLHYEYKGFPETPVSAVKDPTFFLSESGPVNPEAELRATIEALRQPPIKPGDHALCRFPARAYWISRMTGVAWHDSVDCPEWVHWWDKHSNSSIGLVYVSGYLGNPASYFGHLLIHLDPSGKPPSQRDVGRLLDTSLNFGADIPKDDGLVKYISKGLVGGYQAMFSEAPFYRNSAVYSETEMRNLWYYRMRLADWERVLLLKHLWEIMGREYDYFFIGQNCATRIARTLDLVVEQPLNSPGLPFESPEGVIRAATMMSRNGLPLLEDPEYIPSRQLVTRARFEALSEIQKNVALAVWPSIDQFQLETASYQSLSTTDKIALIETLMSHATFLKQTTKHEGVAEIERQLLAERLQLPTANTKFGLEPAVPVSKASPSGRFELSALHNSEHGDGLRLVLRPLHYDLLDSSTARQPAAALEVGRIEVDVGFGEPEISGVVFARVTNLQIEKNPLPLMRKYAWHFSLEAERRDLDCLDCLDLRLEFLAGKSIGKNRHTAYAMGGGVLRTQQHYDGELALLVKAGAIVNWTTSQRTVATIQHEDASEGVDGRSTRVRAGHRIRLSRTADARIGIEGTDPGEATEISIGLSVYF